MKDKFFNINFILYFVYLLIYVVTVCLYGFGNNIANFRYYALCVLCLYGFVVCFLFKKIGKQFINKSFLISIIVSMIFLFFSFIKANNYGVSVPVRTYVQISLFLFPTIYAFYVSNFISINGVIKMMKLTTIVLIFAYFFDTNEMSHHFLNFFNIENWFKIDYINSNSFTESHNWSESFLQLFIFFYYFYKKDGDSYNKRILKVYMYISMIFTLLCFKRLSILIVFFFFLFGKKLLNKKPKRSYYIILTCLYILATIFYTMFMRNEFMDYDTVFKFTTGRNWILKLWSFSNYLSYGYGSSMLIIGRYLELDLIQIYLELNLFCLGLFIFCYFNISKNNLYCLAITFFAFLNMLTASSLPWQISWVIMMINISTILKYNIETSENDLVIKGDNNEKKFNNKNKKEISNI